MALKLKESKVRLALTSLSALLAVYAVLAFPLAAIADPGIDQAIVKVYTVSSSPDYNYPWSGISSEYFMGSGCIIGDRQILTNAHVVGDQTYIQVSRPADPNRYQARVLHVDHDVDLALITVDDPKFFSGVQPLQLGKLPKLQQEVRVFGYPMGGDTLSITKGIISRIEDHIYAHSNEDFLTVQIDAPINPGNSGGPAIVNNRIVGIAMQHIRGAQGIGYIIPTPIIEHFLKDVQGTKYHGFPELGIKVQSMVNPDQRKYFGLSPAQTGPMVTKICPGSPAEGKLRTDDVLLKVDGNAISNEGSIELRPKEWTNFSYYVQMHQIGEALDLGILRGGKYETVTIKLDKTPSDFALMPIEYDTLPHYYIFGGLVFVPVTINYLKTYGTEWETQAPSNLLSRLQSGCKSTEGEEVVLLLKVLADDSNKGYHDFGILVITKVNGEKIINLRDLVRIVEASPEEKFLVFESADGRQIILNKKRAVENNNKILAMYHISQASFLGIKEEAPPSTSQVISDP